MKNRIVGAATRELRGRPRKLQIRGQRASPLHDVYYYLMQAPWWHVIALAGAVFLVLNLVFALIFLAVGGVKGARPGSFADVFFFSVQTMGTIGYGALSPESVAANVVVTIEAFVSLLSAAMTTGLAFAKFSRPTARILFSNQMVIAPRDGKRTLMVRVANERATHIAEAQMRFGMLRTETTLEGETLRRIHDLRLVRAQTPAFIMTWTGLHVIDETSPIHGMTPESLAETDLEFIVTVMGHDSTFAATIHARKTYRWSDVVWNKRFADVIVEEDGMRVIDYARFHDLIDSPSAMSEG